MPPDNANIARHLAFMASTQPHIAALKIPRGRTRAGNIDYLTLSFAELAAEVAAWRATLIARHVQPGDRVLLMVRPGLPLIAAAFALFNHGAVPVVIDPGMGLKSFLACVERSAPRVLLGIPLARLISHVYRKAFRTVRIRIPASGSPTARQTGGAETRTDANPNLPGRPETCALASAASDLAAILFTSGSTGAPKGVRYTHGMFDAQIELIREAYDIRPGEIDLPLLPVFALFNPALGVTTIVPEIDPSRPASVDPQKIIQAIRQENVTSSFGSPTLWRKIAVHCHQHRIELPTLKRVLCAGAPVPTDLWELMTPVLPQGTLHSPYGATESLPVSSISAPEMLAGPAVATQHGAGTCVGYPLAANEVKIIALTDGPIAHLSDACPLPAGQIGEIIVRGPTVTHEYDALPDATAAAKIRDNPLPSPTHPASASVLAVGHETRGAPPASGALSSSPASPESSGTGSVWHRLGDAGYLDGDGRLWFCGRKAERVETTAGTLHTEQVEPIFNTHPNVRRSALIGLGERGRQRLAVVIEPTATSLIRTSADCRRFARELRELAKRFPHTSPIKLFYFREKFPVDVRHNAKIHRLTLSRWALTAKGYESDPKR